MFTAQSQQAIDQAQLFSTRYTTKGGSQIVPGRVSSQLREALGIRENQLPPFVYRMREYGYPIGWLLEARVAKSNLAVHDGHTNGAALQQAAAGSADAPIDIEMGLLLVFILNKLLFFSFRLIWFIFYLFIFTEAQNDQSKLLLS